MAEDNSNNPQRPPAPGPIIPGVPQPPVPSAQDIHRVMAEQQQATERQRQEMVALTNRQQAAARAAADSEGVETAPQADPLAGVPSSVRQSMPQSMSNPVPPAAPSPVPGMTAAEVFAGAPHQGQRFASPVPEAPPPLKKVRWSQVRRGAPQVDLSAYSLVGVPEVDGETDPSARVVRVLLDEILRLRAAVGHLLEGGAGGQQSNDLIMGRIAGLEAVLFEQRRGMGQRARSVREQVEMYQAKGMSPEEIVLALSDQSARAEKESSGEGGE